MFWITGESARSPQTAIDQIPEKEVISSVVIDSGSGTIPASFSLKKGATIEHESAICSVQIEDGPPGKKN